MPADGTFKLARVIFDATADDGEVGAAQGAVFELRGQRAVAGVVSSNDDQPRGALVEPMHYPRPCHAPRRGPGPATTKQRMNQRPAVVTGRGMHHHAGGLVYDGDVLLLIHDLERNWLGRKIRRRKLRGLDVYDIYPPHLFPW